ncbi:hypothetical protein [Gillisia limnaea]|uniref:Nicotinic acid mononucleotide adenyltransferase n=1 Tax=Gillisia limnaea (strain DSM 15749 / LMG 21470 / R-8282) TaxID=865937 RepID=H2BW19_GILLR|nr:hypothetical protein [Gillisia limnaea]EHQ02936.1 nicotinic acid mononucleotide adenyltransferase [Gillisia limnaea DSM 15749]
MKNLVIGLFVLGLTSLGFSQNTTSEVEEVQLEGVVVSNVNLNYLEKVQDKTLSDHVIFLEKEASIFDVKKLVEFDGRKESFQVLFKGSNGYIIADYDRNGKILKTLERYKDIKLPKNMIKSVLMQYPNSNFLKVVYNVNYDEKKDVEKTYKIQIMNDGRKRNLKINRGDNINNAVTLSMID